MRGSKSEILFPTINRSKDFLTITEALGENEKQSKFY